MAGGIAHDFNNLLTSIIGNLSLGLLKFEQGEDAAPLVQVALSAADQAAKLTRQLLQIARRQTAQVAATNVREVIQEVLALLCSTFDRRIRLVDNIAEDLWSVRADPNQIHQIVMNLCLNSRDALQERHGADFRGSKGNPWLQINAENVALRESDSGSAGHARPGQYARLTVSDNGSGMDWQTIAHIFEPFFTTKPKEKGTGLGLSMVYTIVDSLGGWINVESEAGIGTDMIIYLPKADEAAAQRPAPATHAVHPPAGGGKILVVEDEDTIRRLMLDVLGQQGFTVHEAKDGVEAWGMLKREEVAFDLVILDLIMPEMSGYDVLRHMRKKGLHVPVIVCSGFPGDISESELQELGVRQFLPKPFELSVFLQSVHDILGPSAAKPD
jgi:two-component system cell cycle sensor histidine kinase/response regulator CckA